MTDGTKHVSRDEFSYLEDSNDPRTRAWVKVHNDQTLKTLESDPRFHSYYNAALAGYDSLGELKNAAFGLALNGGWVYQIAIDSNHPKGLWRRTRLKAYLLSAPQWEILLNVDDLAIREGRAWTLVPAELLSFSPNGRRCLLRLSEAGSNVFQIREFDLDRREFVDGGFTAPPGQLASVAWRDNDTILLSTDFGDGKSTTDAGYPMVVRQWTRGQPLSSAKEVFRAHRADYAVFVVPQDSVVDDGEAARHRKAARVSILRYDRELNGTWWQLGASGSLERMFVPSVPVMGTYVSSGSSSEDQYVFMTKNDWSVGTKTWRAGSLLSIPAGQITGKAPDISLVWEPASEESIFGNFVVTNEGLLIVTARLGSSTLWRLRLISGRWFSERIPFPEHGMIRICMSDAANVFALFESHLQSPTLYRIDVTHNQITVVRASPSQFDRDRFITERIETRSTDGIRVPYLVTRAKNLQFDRLAPTLVYAYGAFGDATLPSYSPSLGRLWLEKGGVYVVANIRGGRERGESWHVTRRERQHTYDDMESVVRDLMSRQITGPKKMAVMGFSAGGLVAGVMINKHPELFGAAVLRAPMLDNFRYDLLMGTPAAWYSEFGSPVDRSDREFLEHTSPFQNLRKVIKFPTPLLLTSTNDQNVLPAQPRRYAAKLASLHLPYLYYESPDGGHGGSATLDGQARIDALVYVYLTRALMDPRDATH